MFLRNYQTGIPTTFVVALVVLSGFAYGMFQTFHHRIFDGCLEMLTLALFAFTFHMRFNKDSELR